MANVLSCNIVVREFELQTRYYVRFWTNTVRKGMDSFIPLVMDKWYRYYSSTTMPLALVVNKVGNRSREPPEGSLFNSYYTEV